jgi:hypothetical protein
VSTIHHPGDPLRKPIDPRAQTALSRDLAEVDDLWRRLDIVVLTPPAAGSAVSISAARSSGWAPTLFEVVRLGADDPSRIYTNDI